MRRQVDHFPQTFACTSYAPLGQRLVVELKERGRWSLARPLGRALAAAVARTCLQQGWGSATLVPMPSRASSIRGRGSDVVRVMVAATSRTLCATGLDVKMRPLLRLQGQLRDQVGLSRAERQINLRGKLAMRGPVPSGPVIVCDDVVTSGASMAEAARVLSASGVDAVVGVALAARGWQ